jgi:hypothetical protein
VQGPVRADGVVVVGEPVQLRLQAGDGVGGFLFGQPLLLGLVEAFDLAAGLRVVGAGVGVADPEQAEVDLDGDPAGAAGFAGEDCAVEFLGVVKAVGPLGLS